MDHNHEHHQKQTELHDKHTGHHTDDFLKKFWISLALTVPVFFYSEMAKEVFDIRGPEFYGWQYVLLIFGSTIYFYCGMSFLQGAYREIKARLLGMMTLIAIAVTSAYSYSVFSILSGGMHDLMFELASLITIMLIGHWVEMKSVTGAQGALKELSKLLPDTAEVFRGNKTKIISLTELKVGDVVLIKPGSKIPADGKVIEGQSNVNESILTGESRPVHKAQGSLVIAGSINDEGSLSVEIMTIGEKTFLAGVMRLVADAQASKSHLQILSDKAAFYLTIIAIVASSITFVSWLVAGSGMVTAVERFVAVLVIACPHALGLAVPLVAAISTTMAAKNGLLIRERIALEGARKIDTVLFDKTGTLTKGDFGVISVTSDEVLALAAAVETHSEHSIGKAILREAQKRNLKIGEVRDFKTIAGTGAEAKVDGATIFVGHTGGKDIVVLKDGKEIGIIEIADSIRPEAKEAVAKLKALGVSVVMITGDSDDVAKEVASELGIEEYFARVLPGEKSDKVKLLQSKGRIVAMVGDGVNDAPALAEADLGVAVGAGTNVAIESAGIILVRNDPRDILKIINLSKFTYNKMIQNLFWATGYNVVAIPLAGGVLVSQGIILEPWLAALFMSVSTVIVAFNAVLLNNKQI